MNRKYPKQPLVGVGAVILKDDAVLLIKRGRAPLRDQWSLPGGTIETGETLHEGLRREILEETGLRIQVGPLIEIFERIQRDRRGRVVYHFIILDYLATRFRGRLKAGSDVKSARFVKVRALRKYRLTKIARAVIRRGFRSGRKPARRTP